MRFLFFIVLAGFLFHSEKTSGCDIGLNDLTWLNRPDDHSEILLDYTSPRPIANVEIITNIPGIKEALTVNWDENGIKISPSAAWKDLLDKFRPTNPSYFVVVPNGIVVTYQDELSPQPPCGFTISLFDTNNQKPEFSNIPGKITFTIPPTWNPEIPLNYKLENKLVVEDGDYDKENAVISIQTSNPEAISGEAIQRVESTRPVTYQSDVQLFLKDVKNGTYEIIPFDGVNEGSPITVEIVVEYKNLHSPQFRNTKYFHVFNEKPNPGDVFSVDFEAYDDDNDELEISVSETLVEYNPDDQTFTLRGNAEDYVGLKTVIMTATEKGSKAPYNSAKVDLVLHFAGEIMPLPTFDKPHYLFEHSENPSAGDPSAKISVTNYPIEELTLTLSDNSKLEIDSVGQLKFISDVAEDDFGPNRVYSLDVIATVTADPTRQSHVTIVLTFPLTETTTPTTPTTTSTTTTTLPTTTTSTCEPCPTTTTMTTTSPTPTTPCDEGDETCVTTTPVCPPTPPPCDCTTTTGIPGSSSDPTVSTTTEGTGSTCPPTDCSSCPTTTTSSGSTLPSSPCTTFDTSSTSISSSSATPPGGTSPPCTSPPECDICVPCEQDGSCDCDDDEDKDCSNVGLMVALIVISVLCLLLIGGALYLLWLLRKPKADATTQTQSMDDFPPTSFMLNEPSNKRFSFGHVSLGAAAAGSEPGYANPRFSVEKPASSMLYSTVLDPEPIPLASPSVPLEGALASSTPPDALYSTPAKKSNLKSPKDIEPDYEEKPAPVVTQAVQPTKKISDVREPRVLFATKDDVKVIEDTVAPQDEENEFSSDSDGDYERL